jgi:hypothetical protein
MPKVGKNAQKIAPRNRARKQALKTSVFSSKLFFLGRVGKTLDGPLEKFCVDKSEEPDPDLSPSTKDHGKPVKKLQA